MEEKITNKALVDAIIKLKAGDSPATRKVYLEELVKARYIVPVIFDPKPEKNADGKYVIKGKMKINFRLLTNKDDEHMLACFTDEESFNNGVNEVGLDKIIMSFKEMTAVVANSKGEISGMVINPYGENSMLLPAKIMQAIQNSNGAPSPIKKEEVPFNTKIKVRTPKYMPIDMLEAAKEFFSKTDNVKAAYLQLMDKENGNEEYLMAVDIDGNEEPLFEKIFPVLSEHSFGIPVNLTTVNNSLGGAIAGKVEPFYIKEEQE